MVILGLIMIVGQVMGAIKCFGGGKNRPKWLDIVVGICVCLMLLALIGLSAE